MTQLAFAEGGNPDGPPVVFLHGFLSSNLQWQPNRVQLEAEFRTIFVELPGHGASPIPANAAACSPDAIAAALDDIRLSLGLEKWTVVGQSLGGAMGLWYTLTYPDHVRSVAFTNSRAAFGFSRAAKSDGGLRPTSVAEMRALPFHPIHAKRIPEPLKSDMVAAADAVELEAVTYVTSHTGAWDAVDRFGEFTCPVLLVNGVWEKAFQPCAAQAVELIPGLELVELEGGHSINIDQPDAFSDALIDFVLRSTSQLAN